MPNTRVEASGVWGVMFKLGLALIPFVLIWISWVTTQAWEIRTEMLNAHRIYDIALAQRAVSEKNFVTWRELESEKKQMQQPPAWLKERLKSIDDRSARIESRLTKIEAKL